MLILLELCVYTTHYIQLQYVCQIIQILTDTIISSSTSYYIAIDVKVGEGERLVGTKVAHDNLCLGYQVSIVVSIVIGINVMIFIFLNLL